MTAEISSLFKTELPQCPQCQAETSVDDSFCQECGAALLRTPKATALPDMKRLHPRLAKPVVALPLIILSLAAMAIVPLSLIGFEKSYSGFSVKYATEQAAKAYKENHLDEAVTVLERLAISHKLDEEQRLLLNDTYLARADNRASSSDYKNAIGDLEKITPEYAKFVLVSLKKHDFAELLTKQHSQSGLSIAPAKTRLKIADRAKSRLFIKTSPSAQPSPAPTSTALKTSSPESSISSTTTVSPTPTPAPAPATNQDSHEKLAQSAPAKSKNAKYAENDLVRYNELLAGYFSQDRKNSSATAEPPSLKEWIDLGKPRF